MKKFLDKTAYSVVYSESLKSVISPSSRWLDGKKASHHYYPKERPALLEFLKREKSHENTHLH